MNYSKLFTPHHVAIVYDWLNERGELFIHLEFPHSGGSGFSYVVSSLAEIKNLLSAKNHLEIEIFIFKNKPQSDEELDERLDLKWIYKNSENVLYLAVKKNRNHYEQYAKDSAGYKEVIEAWFEKE